MGWINHPSFDEISLLMRAGKIVSLTVFLKVVNQIVVRSSMNYCDFIRIVLKLIFQFKNEVK